MAYMLMNPPIGSGADGPLCVTYTYPNQVTELRCDSTTSSMLQVAWTYTGFTTPILLPRVLEQYTSFVYKSVSTGTQLPPSSTSSASAPASTSMSSASASASSSTSSASASASSSTTTAMPTLSASSGSNVGAVAGGAVGGIAVVVIILGVILLLRRRRRNNAHQNIHRSQPVEAPDSSRPAELYQSSKTYRNRIVELQG